MADTILGYEVVSPEEQRKWAFKTLVGAVLFVIGGIGTLFLVSHWEQSGHVQALATINGYDSKCRYVVRSISKRARYYDHTGYIDCATAHRVAENNNHPLGSVQRRTMANIDFTTNDGDRVNTHIALSGGDEFSDGQEIEILYREDDPSRVKEFTKIPLFGKRSLNETAASEVQFAASETAAPRKPRASDTVSKTTKRWIGFIGSLVMLIGAYWVVTRFYRLVKWLLFGSNAATPNRTAQAAPVASARINRVMHRAPQKGFGRR